MFAAHPVKAKLMLAAAVNTSVFVINNKFLFILKAPHNKRLSNISQIKIVVVHLLLYYKSIKSQVLSINWETMEGKFVKKLFIKTLLTNNKDCNIIAYEEISTR